MDAHAGGGRLPPELEEALMGLSAGDRAEVTLSGVFEASGPCAPVILLREEIAEEGDVTPGEVRHVWDGKRRSLRPFRVVAVSGALVSADFENPHPRRAVKVSLVVESVRPATAGEIAEARKAMKGSEPA